MLKTGRVLITAIFIIVIWLSGCSKAATQTVSGKQKNELIAFAKTICQIAQEAKVREFVKAAHSRGRELKDYYDFLREIRIGDQPEWQVEANREDGSDFFVSFKTSRGITVTMEIARAETKELKFCSITD